MRRRSIGFLVSVVVFLGGAIVGAETGRASWERAQVQVVTVHYKTHDGYDRAAYVVLPEWYRPGSDPPLPLIISPHGRGVSAEENVDRWGNLPALGAFAVVNPEGQGRRLEHFSWGYTGQISDLARMLGIVERAIPWLRIERSRIYAFGTSMGGQEVLLLVAHDPSLLAGAAAFDPVTDMAQRYRDFGRVTCNRRCLHAWGGSLGRGLQDLAREEIGATPSSNPRAYAVRSPITYAHAIAKSGVPLELWWSRSDRVVSARDQSVRLVHAIERLHPTAALETFPGAWPHSADMEPHYMLIPALKRFGLFRSRGA